MSRWLYLWCAALSSLYGQEPICCYLTLPCDPLHELSMHWHYPAGDQEVAEAPLYLRAEGVVSWRTYVPRLSPWESGHRTVCSVRVQDLQPDTRYEFRIGRRGSIHTARTCPDPKQGVLRFAVGGDMRHPWTSGRFRGMCRKVAAESPHFVVAGGDLAYCHGAPHHASRWFKFLGEWSALMRTPEGDHIPIAPLIGNHEVAGGYDEPPEKAPHFFAVFPEGGGSPRVIQLGHVASFLLLDSGHVTPIPGAQEAWLRQELALRKDQLFRFAAYHVPAYGARTTRNRVFHLLRKHWVPLFEQGGVSVAFEHHLHALKRTHPIMQGARSQQGVIYCGDGCWGVWERTTTKESLPDALTAFRQASNGCWMGELLGRKCVLRAINGAGEELDRCVLGGSPVASRMGAGHSTRMHGREMLQPPGLPKNRLPHSSR